VEYYVSTDPDPEDFADLFKDGDSKPIPELYLLPTDSEFRRRGLGGPCNTNRAMRREASRAANGATCQEALEDLKDLLHPRRKKVPGHTDPKINHFVRTRMEGMQSLLNFYTNLLSMTYEKWSASSRQASISLGRERYCARHFRHLVRQFIKDRKVLPIKPYGQWNESLLVDEDLANEINIYL
jgi:hypothetical protein